MTTAEIAAKIAALKTMIGEYVSRMNPLAAADDEVNAKLCEMADAAEAEIDRLERTLAVRETAKALKAY